MVQNNNTSFELSHSTLCAQQQKRIMSMGQLSVQQISMNNAQTDHFIVPERHDALHAPAQFRLHVRLSGRQEVFASITDTSLSIKNIFTNSISNTQNVLKFSSPHTSTTLSKLILQPCLSRRAVSLDWRHQRLLGAAPSCRTRTVG